MPISFLWQMLWKKPMRRSPFKIDCVGGKKVGGIMLYLFRVEHGNCSFLTCILYWYSTRCYLIIYVGKLRLHNKYIPDLFLIRYDIKDIFHNVSNYWMLGQKVCCFKIWKLNFSQVKWLRNHIKKKKKKGVSFLDSKSCAVLERVNFLPHSENIYQTRPIELASFFSVFNLARITLKK